MNAFLAIISNIYIMHSIFKSNIPRIIRKKSKISVILKKRSTKNFFFFKNVTIAKHSKHWSFKKSFTNDKKTRFSKNPNISFSCFFFWPTSSIKTTGTRPARVWKANHPSKIAAFHLFTGEKLFGRFHK